MSAISNIVSPYGDIQQTTDALADASPVSKLAYEFCTAFGVQVSLKQPSHTKTYEVVSTDGIPLGALLTGTTRNRDGDHETVYYFESPNIVQKAKGSSRSNRSTRDSNSIKSLITTLKKQKEIPEVKSMYKAFAAGMRFAFTNVSNARPPSISIDGKKAIDLIEHILLDRPLGPEQNSELKKVYEGYKSEMQSYHSSTSNSDRFNLGVKIIGIAGNRQKPYYLVGEASYDGKGSSDGVTIHGDLKRYNSLKDVPEFAVDVAMINAYMEGLSNNDRNNEFCLPRRDTYYRDIDVATGYSGDELWVAIPKTAP
jgi:hypothetical protein